MKYINKLLLLTIISTNLVASKEITIEWLKTKPRTIAKDFYIWQYLDQNITSKQAIDALGQAKRVNWKLLKRYAKRLNDKDTTKVINCKKAKGIDLIDKDTDCIEIGMTTYTATKLNDTQLEKVAMKMKKKYPNSAKRFEILSSILPFTKLVSSKEKIFFDIFNKCGTKYRIEHFNYKLPKSTLKRLSKKKAFETTLKLIITTPKLDILQQSLLEITDVKNLSHLSRFYLALNAINHDKIDKALIYLKESAKKTYFQMDNDKILFWQYQLTKDATILDKLSKSWNINIYSLYALEAKNQTPQNIIYNIEQKKDSKVHFNTTSPFSWIPILDKAKNISDDKYKTYINLFVENSTLPHLTYVSERYYRYKRSYFITPFEKELENIDVKRKILIYSLGRQESKFIPTSISSSYAMGVMQIMPFLSKTIAKELNEEYNIHDQLNPTINLRYADHHLDYLEKHLNNPLLISYAYNGGISFVNKTVLKRYFKNNKYDPYLSMELIPYNETRLYGKKVLANYYIYSNYFGIKITMKELFNSITRLKI